MHFIKYQGTDALSHPSPQFTLINHIIGSAGIVNLTSAKRIVLRWTTEVIFRVGNLF